MCADFTTSGQRGFVPFGICDLVFIRASEFFAVFPVEQRTDAPDNEITMWAWHHRSWALGTPPTQSYDVSQTKGQREQGLPQHFIDVSVADVFMDFIYHAELHSAVNNLLVCVATISLRQSVLTAHACQGCGFFERKNLACNQACLSPSDCGSSLFSPRNRKQMCQHTRACSLCFEGLKMKGDICSIKSHLNVTVLAANILSLHYLCLTWFCVDSGAVVSYLWYYEVYQAWRHWRPRRETLNPPLPIWDVALLSHLIYYSNLTQSLTCGKKSVFLPL